MIKGSNPAAPTSIVCNSACAEFTCIISNSACAEFTCSICNSALSYEALAKEDSSP